MSNPHRSNLIDIAVILLSETERAYLVETGDIDAKGNPIRIWLPKSQVELNTDDTMTMPEWLAKEKGLI